MKDFTLSAGDGEGNSTMNESAIDVVKKSLKKDFLAFIGIFSLISLFIWALGMIYFFQPSLGWALWFAFSIAGAIIGLIAGVDED